MIVYVEAAGCTNACRHCGANGHPPYGAIYSIDELRKLVETWEPITSYYEPTAHPDFPEIISPQIVGYEGEVLSTNGFGLARVENYSTVFDRLREFGYNMISCTLHGLEENHDWFVARKGAYSEDFKHPFEPRTWPPTPSFEKLSILITRNRNVYLEPECAPRIFLDELDVGKDRILKKLQELPTPRGYLIEPPNVNLIDDDAELLHPNGHSVRYKTISAALFQDS
jgi:hypothetical protein